VGSTLLALVALVAALAKPVVGLGRIEAEQADAERDARACRAERALLDGYEHARGSERAAEALRTLSTRLAQDVPPIEIHGVLRLLANVHRIELGSATIGAPVSTSFAELDDRVMLREVDVSGRGEPARWVALIADLERAGYTTAVLECALSRAHPRDTAYEVHLVLGLYSSRPTAAQKSGGA
jgi:hypothetical protein